MTKFTIAASLAIFTLGAVVGHATAPISAAVAEAQIQPVSSYELTLRASALPVQTADAI